MIPMPCYDGPQGLSYMASKKALQCLWSLI
jgi:hypothetical protein